MDFSLLQELKLKVTNSNFKSRISDKWHVTYDDKTKVLDVKEIFNLFVDGKIFIYTKCRCEDQKYTMPIKRDEDLMKHILIIKEHLEEENKILLHNWVKRRKVIEDFKNEYESALERLRVTDLNQNVLATAQFIKLNPRVKRKRRVKKVSFNLENNCVLGVHDDFMFLKKV